MRAQQRGQELDEAALVGDRCVAAAQFLHHQRVGEAVQPGAAQCLGHGDAEEAVSPPSAGRCPRETIPRGPAARRADGSPRPRSGASCRRLVDARGSAACSFQLGSRLGGQRRAAGCHSTPCSITPAPPCMTMGSSTRPTMRIAGIARGSGPAGPHRPPRSPSAPVRNCRPRCRARGRAEPAVTTAASAVGARAATSLL